MDIQNQIKTLTKEIGVIEARIVIDKATLSQCKRALKAFGKIEEQASQIKMPEIEKRISVVSVNESK